MSAPSTLEASRHSGATRLGVASLAAVLLVTFAIVDAAPTEARNWTAQIAATRAGQISAEQSMRTADRQIRQLKRARRQTQRRVKQTRRNLARVKARRAIIQARYEAAHVELLEARATLAAAQVPPTATPPALVVPDEATTASAWEPPVADVIVSPAGILVNGLVAGAPTLRSEISVGDVRDLEKQVKQQHKAANKAGKKVRRVQRSMRVRQRQLRSFKHRRAAAIARRESAEAALGSRILAMSVLAQRRVAKKTRVRPGRNSGFMWPTRGRISQTYGCTGFYLNPARGSCRHFHDGIDIVSYRGSPIRAAAVGVISYVGWNPWDQHGRAFMIVVAHPGGYETLYGHVLPTRRVRVGQVVKKGQVIASMGNTGNSTGVHLHLELRRGRVTLNPLAYL